MQKLNSQIYIPEVNKLPDYFPEIDIESIIDGELGEDVISGNDSPDKDLIMPPETLH